MKIRKLEKALKQHGHRIPNKNDENDSQEEMEEKKISEEINKMNQENLQQIVLHNKNQIIDPDLKLLIEFDEKEQAYKKMEHSLIILERKNQELQKENFRIKEEYENLIFKLEQKNIEKKIIIVERNNLIEDQKIQTVYNLIIIFRVFWKRKSKES